MIVNAAGHAHIVVMILKECGIIWTQFLGYFTTQRKTIEGITTLFAS